LFFLSQISVLSHNKSATVFFLAGL
jgi:hypothetical protein